MKILGIFNVSNTNYMKFVDDITLNINKLQDDDQIVEVQYQVNSFPNGQIVYSALILGRR